MANEQQNEPVVENNNAPEEIISDDVELKMPDQAFGTASGSQNKPSALGPILAVLIVVLILLLGALYLWSTMLAEPPIDTGAITRPTAEENNEPESTTAEANVQAIETVSTSDEITALEADIESTDLDEIDAELNAIESELDAALQ